MEQPIIDALAHRLERLEREYRRWKRRRDSRVAGKHRCFPAPYEPYVRLAPHTAQAFTNAPRGTRPLRARPRAVSWLARIVSGYSPA
jgi:hypothetical protein